jgi:hypothetical protein
MATETEQLEHRVSEIERELAKLKSAVLQRDKFPWWRQIIGEFEGNEAYAEIVRLGQELRRAERPE